MLRESRNPDAATAGWRRWVERGIGLVLALLLLRSSLIHVGQPYYFLSSVYGYGLTGIVLGKWIAVVLPFVQLVVALCLLVHWWPRPASLLALVMFLTFVGVQVTALWRGLEIPCGCFGASGSLLLGPTTVALAATGAVLAAFAFFLAPRRSS